ncbi:MAG: FAD-dependent oxidoreductase, partial [Candidatus Nanopelagicales bacterium]
TVLRFDAQPKGKLAAILLRGSDGIEYLHRADAAFVFIGMQPNTEWLEGAIDLDERGFIVTDRTLSTSVPGVFAAGDIRAGSTKQLAAAVGEGAAVALQVRYHLSHRGNDA